MAKDPQPAKTDRLPVLKTYKIYIGGQFPRTESGRYFEARAADGRLLANMCLSSRKDFRDAVVAARSAFATWSRRPAFNRGQILYRMAEMLESRRSAFLEELQVQGISANKAADELNTAVDRLIYYAGWCDKYHQIMGAVNPVASSHFNFSTPEPMGVVAILAPEADALLGLISLMAPVIAGGNTCVMLAGDAKPLCAISFAEVLNSSDLPAGVVNILTGRQQELAPFFADHMDVNAVVHAVTQPEIKQIIAEKAALNLKRVMHYAPASWSDEQEQSPYHILDTQEIKTTWHPIENISGGKSGY